MAVPKRRKTKSRRNQRRMHLRLDSPALTECSQCKEKKLMHVVCPACGYYKDKEVVDVLKKDKKKIDNTSNAKEEKPKKMSMESLSQKEKK